MIVCAFGTENTDGKDKKMLFLQVRSLFDNNPKILTAGIPD